MLFLLLHGSFIRVPTGQGNWEKSENLCGRKGWGKYFLEKVGESEKLVPPDVRFSGQNVSYLIFAGSVPQMSLRELTALPQAP